MAVFLYKFNGFVNGMNRLCLKKLFFIFHICIMEKLWEGENK